MKRVLWRTILALFLSCALLTSPLAQDNNQLADMSYAATFAEYFLDWSGPSDLKEKLQGLDSRIKKIVSFRTCVS